jgi:hypothetical protein
MPKRKTPEKPVAARRSRKPRKINPAALAAADMAKILSRAGDRPVTAADIRAAVAAGAPANKDRTLHLLHFVAWLVTAVSAAA